ncbi:MAG TPA: AI-2E family transporter [Bacteroidota bacterium]|nr:AI-2E family transporter [Bacteroidota bacterium]
MGPQELSDHSIRFAAGPGSFPKTAEESFLSRRWKVFLVTASVALPIAFLALFNNVFLILVISVAATMVFNPVVDFFEQKGVARPVSIIAIYLIVGGLVAAGLMNLYGIIVHQAEGFTSSLDDEHLHALFAQLGASVAGQIPSLNAQAVAARLNGALPQVASRAEESLAGAVNILGSLVIVPFITFFLLNDYHRIQKIFIRNVPNKYFEMTLNVIYKLEQQLSRYIRGVCIELTVVGILYMSAYSILGFRYAILLGIVCGISNIIPMAGPLIAAIPVIFASLLQYGDFRMILPIVLTTFIVQQIDQMFVQPNVYGKILDMHPLTIVLTILIGSQLLGIVGMVLAIPIYTVIKVTARETNWGLMHYKITR